MDVMLAQGPSHMAAKLATYIKDPSTIRAHVLNEYGRGPSLDYIKAEIAKHSRPSRRDIGEPEYGDGEVYAPTFRSNRAKPIKFTPVPAEVVANYTLKPLPESVVEKFMRQPEGYKAAAALIESVGRDFDVGPNDMRGPSRFKAMFHARSVVVRLMAEQDWSFNRIGKFLGGRDHSTVINAFHMFETYAQRDPRVMESYLRHRDMMDA